MITYLPLDFETTGTDPWGDVIGGKVAAPIQIGIYVPEISLRLESLIGGWDWNKYEWNEVSESIHKITKEEVDAAEPAWKVDIRLAAALLDCTGSRMFNVPMGWNVAGFDRQFIVRHFPNLNRILSYRSVDLNSCLFQLASSEKAYENLKKETKEWAAQRMKSKAFELNIDSEERWHNALYDAEASWYAFCYLQERASGSLQPQGIDLQKQD